MSDLPERIWVGIGPHKELCHGGTQYIRADLAAQREAELVAEVEQKQNVIDHQTEMLRNYFADLAWRHFMDACIKRKVNPSMYDDMCASGAIREALNAENK